MSDRLLAINCGNTQMLQVTDDYKMSVIEQAMEDGRSVDVVVYMSDYGENRIITVHNLHYAKDGWGVTHIKMEDFGNDHDPSRDDGSDF